jgi:nucleotide-binding universal stress UspA family protein
MKPQILVPFDFSPTAERALAWALDLQRSIAHGPVSGGVGALHLLHVVNPMPAVGAGVGVNVPFVTDDAIRETEEALRQMLARRDAAGTVEVLLSPSTGDAICHAAAAHKADLIVMGTHGRGGIKRAVLGSVADFVVRHAGCPVVTLREKTD